jgi:hypothetical protein
VAARPSDGDRQTAGASGRHAGGKTVAQVWDDLFRGDEIFPMLEAALAQRFPGIKFVGYRTFGSTHGADERDVLKSLPARMREHGVDAVISGMAC